GDGSAGIVVDDDPGVRADPRLPHLILELRAGGERMTAASRPPGHRVELDEDSARDMPASIGLVAAAAQQGPTKIDDSEIRIMHVLVQPFRADAGAEARRARTPLGPW